MRDQGAYDKSYATPAQFWSPRVCFLFFVSDKRQRNRGQDCALLIFLAFFLARCSALANILCDFLQCTSEHFVWFSLSPSYNLHNWVWHVYIHHTSIKRHTSRSALFCVSCALFLSSWSCSLWRAVSCRLNAMQRMEAGIANCWVVMLEGPEGPEMPRAVTFLLTDVIGGSRRLEKGSVQSWTLGFGLHYRGKIACMAPEERASKTSEHSYSLCCSVRLYFCLWSAIHKLRVVSATTLQPFPWMMRLEMQVGIF